MYTSHSMTHHIIRWEAPEEEAPRGAPGAAGQQGPLLVRQ